MGPCNKVCRVHQNSPGTRPRRFAPGARGPRPPPSRAVHGPRGVAVRQAGSGLPSQRSGGPPVARRRHYCTPPRAERELRSPVVAVAAVAAVPVGVRRGVQGRDGNGAYLDFRKIVLPERGPFFVGFKKVRLRKTIRTTCSHCVPRGSWTFPKTYAF